MSPALSVAALVLILPLPYTPPPPHRRRSPPRCSLSAVKKVFAKIAGKKGRDTVLLVDWLEFVNHDRRDKADETLEDRGRLYDAQLADELVREMAWLAGVGGEGLGGEGRAAPQQV